MDIRILCRSWAADYVRLVHPPQLRNPNRPENELRLWKDRLFTQLLLYCFPVCLIAVVPCVYISFAVGYYYTGIIDLACFALVSFLTFSHDLSIQAKKYCMITIFYVLGIFLTASLGFIGPGVFYLLAITLFTALFLPVRHAYLTILSNALIILGLSFEIYFHPLDLAINHQYTISQWLVFSSNLIFVSTILVLLIEKIFHGLQKTIDNKESAKVKYQTIFDHSPIPMWLFDNDSLRFLDVNRAAVIQYGYTRSEFLDMTIKDIRPGEGIKDLEEKVSSYRRRYKFNEEGVRHKRKNGETVLVAIESTQIEYNGKPVKLVLASDITKQVETKAEADEANEKVQRSEYNLRAIFDSTEEGFVLLDLDDKIVVSNQKAVNFFTSGLHVTGFRPGNCIFDSVDASRAEEFRSYLTIVRTGQTMEYDRQYATGDSVTWVHYTLTPVFAEDQVIGTCITGRDITGLKLYLRKIEDQNRTLKEISWIQSHLARAPLARIMGLANLILSENDEDERNKMIRFLGQAATEFDQAIKEVTEKISGENDAAQYKALGREADLRGEQRN